MTPCGVPANVLSFGAPVVLPVEALPLRRALDAWFDAHTIRPRVVAECEDSALVKELGASGAGLFPAPTAIERDLTRRYDLKVHPNRQTGLTTSHPKNLSRPAMRGTRCQSRHEHA